MTRFGPWLAAMPAALGLLPAQLASPVVGNDEDVYPFLIDVMLLRQAGCRDHWIALVARRERVIADEIWVCLAAAFRPRFHAERDRMKGGSDIRVPEYLA